MTDKPDLTVVTRNTVGRKPVKRRHMVQSLRDQIVKGHYAPGSQLPTQVELIKLYQAGSTTVQQAIEQLTREGFVYAQSTRGTFVSEHPPHKAQFGLVLPEPLDNPGFHSKFWFHLRDAVVNYPQDPTRRLALYTGPAWGNELQGYRQLTDDVMHHRLAGLIYGTVPYFLNDPTGAAMRKLPCVALMDRVDIEGVPAVYFDWVLYFEQAARLLVQAGATRVAVITAMGLPFGVETPLSKLFARFGLETRDYLEQRPGLFQPDSARRLVHLLMALPEDHRPNGLIVADDHFVTQIGQGLIDCGITRRTQCAVIAHGNFPAIEPCDFPVIRLGFDLPHLVETCLTLLLRMVAGQRVPALTLIPPRQV